MKALFFTSAILATALADSLLFVPLDERFTTRVAFLNMASITNYEIVSMPESLLPSLKKSSPPTDIVSWFSQQIGPTDGAVLSLEMLLYGGLISSRISNDTTEEVTKRFDNIVAAWEASGSRSQMYGSQVVMRIPSYNGDFEEPWFWQNYGEAIFNYSFYTDKYRNT